MALPSLSQSIIKKIDSGKAAVRWDYILNEYKFSEDLLIKYKEFISFCDIDYFQTSSVTKKIVEEYSYKMTKEDWTRISRHNFVDEAFVRKYHDKLDWTTISRKVFLSEDFVEEFKDKVDWYYVSGYRNFSEDFYIKNIKYVNLTSLFVMKSVSEDFIVKCIELLGDEFVYYSDISYRQNLSLSFIEKYKDKLNFANLSQNDYLSDEGVREFVQKIKDEKNDLMVLLRGKGLNLRSI